MVSSWTWTIAWLGALAALKLTLVSAQTLTVFGHAIHDDGLTLARASALLAGDWLGVYDNSTLLKGPFYPAWVAGASALGMPLLLSQHLLYVGACLVLTLALRPMVLRPTLLVPIYALVLFNPISYADRVMTQVNRMGIYPALTILVMACAIALLTGRDRSLVTLTCWSVGLGTTLAAFWLTKEEGLWIVPSLLIVMGGGAIELLRSRPNRSRRRLWLYVIPVCVWQLFMAAVAGINYAHYGVSVTTEARSHPFLAAYGALTRVKHATWRPLIPVPRETRERLYQASSSFAELRPFLEGDTGRGWAYTSCVAIAVCDDIAGGWFAWALRDAVASAGHHGSGAAAAAYYRRVASEVNRACAHQTLECGGERATMMPPWHAGYGWPLLGTLGRGVTLLARLEGLAVHSSPSVGPRESLQPFRDVTHERLSGRYVVRGWSLGESGPVELLVKTGQSAPAVLHLTYEPSPDVSRYLRSRGQYVSGADRARFEISTSCARDCYLHVSSADRPIARVPLDGSVRFLDSPKLKLSLEHIGYEDGGQSWSSRWNEQRLDVLTKISGLYQVAMPVLLGAALLSYAALTVRVLEGPGARAHWLVATGAIVGVGARVLVLSMIEVSSFRALTIGQLAPAYPLLLLFVAMAIGGLRQPGPPRPATQG